MEFLFEEKRFYFDDENGNNLAEVTFSRAGDNLLILDHTWVDDSLRGQGVASKLVLEVVNYAREHNKKIMPLCPFAKIEFERKPEYKDVAQN